MKIEVIAVIETIFPRDLVGFSGISTVVGYLMPNPVYTYISNI